MNEFALLKTLLVRAQYLKLYNEAELDDIKRKGKMALENIFPWKTYSTDIKNIQFKQIRYSLTNYQIHQDWKDGQNKLINLIDTAIKDYEIQMGKTENKPTPVQTKIVIQEKIVPVIDQSAVKVINQQFIEYRKNLKKWVSFSITVSLLTLGVWLFYCFGNWDWYTNHPKKLSITLMVNVTIILLLVNILIKRGWAIWGLIMSTITTLFTII